MIRAATILILAVLLAAPASLWAAEDVGTMIALKGQANVLRAGSGKVASLNDPIELNDVVETSAQSRAKILFIDESMLTLRSNSKASIKEFVYSQEGGGTSIFNLLEGRMRAVVGKTSFEVHTPTTVAAARGTVIEFVVGVYQGVPFTTIVCLEGTVEVSSSDPTISGSVLVGAGTTVTVMQGAPPPEPETTDVPTNIGETNGDDNGDDDTSSDDTGVDTGGDTGDDTGDDDTGGDTTAASVTPTTTTTTPSTTPTTPVAPVLPPIEQEPAAANTPVTININFPGI